MNGWRNLLTLSLAIALAAVSFSCSEDEPEDVTEESTLDAPDAASESEQLAEADEEEVPVAEDATDDIRVSGQGKDFTLILKPPQSTDLADAYYETCADQDRDDIECQVFHSLVIAELTMALETIERSRDQRGTDEALAALDLDQEPEVLVAALRVLGQFSDTPGIAEKVLPLMLDSPWLMVQDLAARVLQANPDPEVAGVGSLWGANHGTLSAENEYSEYPDFPAHYFDMEFPDYPDAEWFPPADSDRSIGWATDDDATTVVDWMRDALEVEPFDYTQWAEHLQAQLMAAMQSVDPSKQERMQQLTDEYLKTQDMALLEEVQKLQQELSAPMEKAARVMDMGVNNITPPFAAGTIEAARFFVAEEKDGHVARLVVVYPLPGIGRTVIQEAWNLLDYPSAWPDQPPGN